MLKTHFSYLYILLLLLSFGSKAQVNLDSLWGVWNDKTQLDTNRLKAMHKISWDGYLFSQPDSAFYFAQMGYDFAEAVDNKKWMSTLLNTQGVSFYFKGNYERALEYYSKSLAIRKKIADKKGMGTSYGNIGNIYDDQGNYEKALEYHSKSLSIEKELGDKKGMGFSYNNIGIIYSNQGNYEKALEYDLKSLAIRKKIGDKKGMAASYNNIGAIYKNQGNYEKALEYFRESIAVKEEINAPVGTQYFNIACILLKQNNVNEALITFHKVEKINNEKGINKDQSQIYVYDGLSRTHYKLKNTKQALDYANRAINLSEKLNYSFGKSFSYYTAAEIYKSLGKTKKSIECANKSLSTSTLIGKQADIKKGANLLYMDYKEIGKYKQALEMHELYMETKDSIAKMDAEEELYKFEVDKEYQLKKQADSILHADEIIIQQAENRAKEEQLKSEKQRRTGLLVIVGLVLVSLGFVFVQLRKTKAQKVVIEGQHEKLNESHREITDSINYAKRIQDALMTSAVYIKDVLPESFILFNPKDVVSGDFYWVYRSPKGQIYFTVADCTGHGVPGAFMSMIGTSLLNEFIIENNTEDTAEVLTNMREQIIKSLDQKGLQGENKDGMDMALCKYDPKKGTVQYSGAYNPLIHISKNQINQLKGDSQPVGLHTGKKLPFTNKEIQVAKGDMLYIYSDGFPDQFGGEKGKKYLSGKFKKFLLSISDKPIDEQNTLIKAEFTKWIGDHEQIDDVCVMGVRIT